MLLELKLAIIRSGRRQYRINQALDWYPGKISAILSGKYIPDSIEKEDLASVLDVSVDEIFPHENKGLSVK